MNQYREQADLGPYYSWSVRAHRVFRNLIRAAFLFSVFWLGVGLPALFENAQQLFHSIPGALSNQHVALHMRLIGIAIVATLGCDVVWIIVAATDSIGITSDALFGKREFLDHPGLPRRAMAPFFQPLALFVAILFVIRIASWVFPPHVPKAANVSGRTAVPHAGQPPKHPPGRQIN